MQVLWITSSLPYPPVTGAKLRVWNLLKYIAPYHAVTLLSLVDQVDDLQFLPQLQRYAQVETVIKQRHRNRGKLFFHLTKTLLKGQPIRNGIAYYEDMKRRVREITCNRAFDIIHIEQSHIAPYIEFLASADNATCFVTLYDVGASQQERLLDVQADFPSRVRTGLDVFFLRRWEPFYVARHFDKCIVVSSNDEILLRQANPVLDLAVIPNGVDTTECKPLPDACDSKDILFIGKMDYAPNVDGVEFFYREIFPLVKSQVPDVRLLIVGQNPPKTVRELNSKDVIITGQVASVLPYYQQSCLSIAPLRAGGGTRLKILEAMALGRPVVSTTIGCEGLVVTHEQNILIADTPADFAKQIIRLLCDHDLRRRIVINARELVEAMYDWKIIGEQLLRVYNQVTSTKPL